MAASELEEGETLHTEDGDIVTVTYNYDEWLKESVKVYNLEVEGLHTYYVTADRVLVHNEYGKNSNIDDAINQIPNDLKKNGECDKFAKAFANIFDKLGISYEIVRVDSGASVYSDKAGTIIGRKFQYGIKIGDLIYDNLTLNGMDFDAWQKDLGIGVVGDIEWNFVNEILNY